MRILLSITTLLTLLGLSFTYLARRTMALVPALQRHPAWVWGFLATFLALLFLVPLANRLSGHRLDFLHALSWGIFAFVSTFLVYLLLADLSQLLLRRMLSLGPTVGTWAWILACGGALISLGIGAIQALSPPRVQEVEVRIEHLAPGLEGFRIVQVSDLHLGPLVSRASVLRLRGQVEALSPDLVAFTGDLVDAEADGAREKAAALKALRSTHGTFFVTGNHEYYSGISRWLPVFQELGWTLLDNMHRPLAHNGATLLVAGMPDPAAGGRRGSGQGPSLSRTLRGAPPSDFRLLLFHPPTGYEAAARAGFDLQLSGHTHAGQYFPWSLVVQRMFRYPKGLGRHGAMWIYTSVGTGFWGPPNRFLVPPELTLLTLRNAS